MSAGDAYREHRPPPDLAHVVACTWSQRLTGAPHREVSIIPDGCVDIVILNGEAPHVAGPATRTLLLQPATANITGIRLRPGAAQLLLGCPMQLVVDREVDLVDLCRRDAHSMTLHDEAVAQRAALLQWTRRRLQAQRGSLLPVVAASAIARDPGLPLDTLMRQLDMSARQLHRTLTAACGYGPKLLQRIMRVQRALRVTARGPMGLAALAQRCGFADQAHMTREFQSLTAATPARYLRCHNPQVGRWLDDAAGLSDSFKTAPLAAG